MFPKRRGFLLFLVAVIWLQAAIVAPAQASGTIKEMMIHTYGTNSWAYNTLATGPNGEIYLTYKASDTEIALKRWNGSAWDALPSVTAAAAGDTAFSDSLDLTVDTGGNLHLVFKHYDGSGVTSHRGVKYGFFNGVSWSFTEIEAYSHPSGSRNFYDPVIAVDSAGKAHIAYKYTDSTVTNQYILRYATNASGTWSVGTVAVGTSAIDEIHDPQIAVDGNDIVHLAYVREDNQNNYYGNYYYTSKLSTAASFPAAVKVVDSVAEGKYYYYSQLEVDAGGAAYFTFSENNSDEQWNFISSTSYIESNKSGSWQRETVYVDSQRDTAPVKVSIVNSTLYLLMDSWAPDWSEHHFFAMANYGNGWVTGNTEVSPTLVDGYTDELTYLVDANGNFMLVMLHGNLRKISSLTGTSADFGLIGAPQPTYSVSYNGNEQTSGTSPNAASYEAGQTVAVSGNTGNLVRTGYTFSGWNSAANGNGTFYSADGSASFIMPAENKVLYAKWTANPYTVSYDAGDGSVTTASQTKLFGSTYGKGADGVAVELLPTPTRAGYTFAGWYTGAGGTGTLITDATTVSSATNHTLYAKWTINSYTVSFNSNGGSNVANLSVNYNAKVNKPADPTKAGYTFAGWYEDSDLEHAFDFAGTAITGNRTLHAKWTANTYTVTFDAAGGTVTPATQTKQFDSVYGKGADGVAVELLPTPTRTGYTFAGWYNGAGGTGALITDATTVSAATNHTLYAKWTINSYTVSFNSNGGSNVANLSVNYNAKVNKPEDPAKAGYTFVGWYEDSDLEHAFDFAGTAITGNRTLHAKWTANTYTVTFDAAGGTVTPATQTKQFDSAYGKGADGTADEQLPTPKRAGYTFAGWYNGAGGTGTLITDVTIVTQAANHTLYAKWTVNTYTVSYDAEGGAVTPATQVKQYDAAYGKSADGVTDESLPTPTKAGYTFAGWYDGVGGTGAQVTNATTVSVAADHTLYAKWTANTYTITYSAEGGTVTPATQTKQYDAAYGKGADGTTDESLPTPTRSGYTFAGWHNGAGGTGALVTNATTVSTASNHTLYAKWTANTYTISYDAKGGTVTPATQMKQYDAAYGKGADGAASELLPTPTRTGYTFAGWYDGDGGTATQVTNATTVSVAADHTLYAKWTVNTYSVDFEAEGGAVAPATQTKQYDAAYGKGADGVTDEPLPTPARTGYTFAGWYDGAGGTGTPVANATTVLVAANHTLYAKWTANTYEVAFDAENGAVTPATQVKQYDAAYGKGSDGVTDELLPTPIREGYTFAGWYDGAGGTGTPVTNTTVVSTAGNHSLYAKWTLNPPAAAEIEAIEPGHQTAIIHWSSVPFAESYEIYQSTTKEVYGSPIASVDGALNSYEATGLLNGTLYYFVVKATNAGGDGPFSYEMNVIPRTVPAAPTKVTATAGNGQATISFTVPEDNGGSEVTGYEVTASPGGYKAVGTSSPIIVKGLTNGTSYSFTVSAINEAGHSEASAISNAVIPYVPAVIEPPKDKDNPATGVDVLVNGKVDNAGKATVTETNGRTTITIEVDEKKLEERLASEGSRSVITIPLQSDSEAVIGELNGHLLKNMEQKQSILELRTNKASYFLPAQLLNIDAIAERLGGKLELKDIRVDIEISVPLDDTVELVENAAEAGGFAIVAPPLNFNVRATYGGKTVDITRFNKYVERMVALPDNVDPSKITTGIVVEPDGSVRHVPTKIEVIDGKYYAKISSLSNSTYSVIWHPLEFKDVERHWAKDAINNMGSRMVISGVGNGLFEPDRDITRAEFAAVIVRGLGLSLEKGSAPFGDVKPSDWYYDAVYTAHAYQLINGFNDGTFRPNDKITREQAMVIIAKAMTITGLKAQLPDMATDDLLAEFADAGKAANWARDGIADSIQAGIVSGRKNAELAPTAFITRAEVALMVQRLLKASELI